MGKKNRLYQISFKLFVTILLITCYFFTQAQNPTSYVVMLSMDGFRWDYPVKCYTPNLDRMGSVGVKAVSIRPSFPSKTFPNHYTMVTGLYPDHHGIVQNEFYDPEINREYRIGDRNAVEDPVFYGGEPIWVTAEKNGIVSASFFWVGSESPVKGMQPTYWKRYDETIPYAQRLDTVIHWLTLPENKRPHLITWYIDEPDAMGHHEGPESQLTCEMVTWLDSLVGDFMARVRALPYADQINIIITSDHGMAQVTQERTIFLKDYLDFNWFGQIQGYTPNYLFYVKEECDSLAWASLQQIPNVEVWRHGQVPPQFNYGTNPRTGDFILVADSSWQVTHRDHAPMPGGAHGYSPFNTDMHAIFYAAGPAFKTGYEHPTFENTNLYILICKILGIDPAPNDGDIRNVQDMLLSK